MHVSGKLPGTEVAPDDAQRADASKTDAQKRSAARQFEGVLMQQLLKVMRETAKNGTMGSSEGASGQYMSMFDEVMANALAEGGGIGLADKLYEAMGGKPDAKPPTQTLPGAEGLARSASRGGLPSDPSRAGVTPPLAGLRGATSRLAQAAYALSAPEGGKQWGRAGTLSARDLASKLTAHAADGDVTGFSTGFRDSYKCNLFAFEAARRAGFEVPVVAREHGLGYPTSNIVTAEAEAGALRGDWADVVDGTRISALKGMLERGEVGLMLTGSGSAGRAGHMALVERIHDVQLDDHGEVQRIEFDGYEARADGAEHLLRRTWNRRGHGEDSKHARNGFDAIELLALRRSGTPESPEVTLAKTSRSAQDRDPARGR